MNTDTDWSLFEKIETTESLLKEDVESTEKKCYSCGSIKIEFVYAEERFVCQECGVILCVMVNEYSASKESSSNISIYIPKSSLGTSIFGNQHSRLRIVNGWMKWIYKEKAFFDDKKFMEEKCYNANFSQSILDNALHLYKKVRDTNTIIRGSKRTGIMAACVYYGAQMQNQSYSPNEISTAFDIHRNYVTKGCKLLNELVTVEQKIESNIVEFTERFCITLQCSDEQKTKAKEIATNIISLSIANNFQPPSIAASILLLLVELDMVSNEVINIELLYSSFKISKCTITKAFKKIKPWIKIISDTSITESYITNKK